MMPSWQRVKKDDVEPTETMATLERVFAVVDGDNLYDFFLKIVESPLDLINHYIGDRTCLVKPAFFFSYDARMENRDWTRYGLAERLWKDKVRGLDFQYRYYNRYRKGYPDMELFIKAMANIDQFDTLLVFTHDGDYACMTKFLQESHSKKVELYHARFAVKDELIDAVDKSIDMLETFVPTSPLKAELEQQHTARRKAW